MNFILRISLFPYCSITNFIELNGTEYHQNYCGNELCLSCYSFFNGYQEDRAIIFISFNDLVDCNANVGYDNQLSICYSFNDDESVG